MARLDPNTVKAIYKQLEKHKIFTIVELADLLKCSISNARLKLRQWNTYTSYNQNGRYYTLPQVPRFDQHGLWRYENAAFSKHGSLKKTIVPGSNGFCGHRQPPIEPATRRFCNQFS